VGARTVRLRLTRSRSATGPREVLQDGNRVLTFNDASALLSLFSSRIDCVSSGDDTELLWDRAMTEVDRRHLFGYTKFYVTSGGRVRLGHPGSTRGEILASAGPNAPGDTTCARIAGIPLPTRGGIRIAWHDLATDPVGAKQQLAFVPDEPSLFEHLTGRGAPPARRPALPTNRVEDVRRE